MPTRLGVASILNGIRRPSTNTLRIPSIGWQVLWNYGFGPFLLWKVRAIHDIYHWRLQTTISIVAGYVNQCFAIKDPD